MRQTLCSLNVWIKATFEVSACSFIDYDCSMWFNFSIKNVLLITFCGLESKFNSKSKYHKNLFIQILVFWLETIFSTYFTNTNFEWLPYKLEYKNKFNSKNCIWLKFIMRSETTHVQWAYVYFIYTTE